MSDPPMDSNSDEAPSDAEDARLHQEELLDQALKETFPASDPISPALPESQEDES